MGVAVVLAGAVMTIDDFFLDKSRESSHDVLYDVSRDVSFVQLLEESMARYPLNLPARLKQDAEKWANDQGVSLNQFILWSVAEKVGALKQNLDDPAFRRVTYRRGASGQPGSDSGSCRPPVGNDTSPDCG
jgi:hypothetical protein